MKIDMGKWMIKHVGWFVIRCILTCVLVYTIQNVIHKQGYYINFNVLLICAIAIIVGVGIWIKPISKED